MSIRADLVFLKIKIFGILSISVYNHITLCSVSWCTHMHMLPYTCNNNSRLCQTFAQLGKKLSNETVYTPTTTTIKTS